MKITPEQAEKLLKIVNSIYKDRSIVVQNGNGSYFVSETVNKLLEDIETANKPMEIEWCIAHDSKRMKPHRWCYALGQDIESCDIRTFVEKEGA